MADSEPTWISLARLVRPQGRRGELLADLLTDFPDLLKQSDHLCLGGTGVSRRPVKVTDYWLPTGRSAGRIVLKFEGTDSISEAELLTGLEVQLPATERTPLEEETYYVTDLVGCDLWDGDQLLGPVTEVRFPVNANGKRLEDAAALFVIQRTAEEELLIPFVNAFVQRLDIAGKRIDMVLPAGLYELNAQDVG